MHLTVICGGEECWLDCSPDVALTELKTAVCDALSLTDANDFDLKVVYAQTLCPGFLLQEEDLLLLSDGDSISPEANRQALAKLELKERGLDCSLESFFRAAEKNDGELCLLFLTAGVDVNVRDGDGVSALVLAAESGSTAALEVLLENGADVNSADARGRTALMHASEMGSLSAVTFLIRHHAQIDRTDLCGETALFIALRNGWADVEFALQRGPEGVRKKKTRRRNRENAEWEGVL